MSIVLLVILCLAVNSAVGFVVGKIFGAESGFIASGLLGIVMLAGAAQAAHASYLGLAMK